MPSSTRTIRTEQYAVWTKSTSFAWRIYKPRIRFQPLDLKTGFQPIFFLVLSQHLLICWHPRLFEKSECVHWKIEAQLFDKLIEKMNRTSYMLPQFFEIGQRIALNTEFELSNIIWPTLINWIIVHDFVIRRCRSRSRRLNQVLKLISR